MLCLGSQAYGARIENRIISEWGGAIKRKNYETGDFLFNDKIYEVKSSILRHDQSFVNLVQLRPYEKCDFFIINVFDVRLLCDGENEEVLYYKFLLSKEEMEEEMDLIKAGNAHGKNNDRNKNKEYRMSFDLNDEDPNTIRWVEKYQIA